MYSVDCPVCGAETTFGEDCWNCGQVAEGIERMIVQTERYERQFEERAEALKGDDLRRNRLYEVTVLTDTGWVTSIELDGVKIGLATQNSRSQAALTRRLQIHRHICRRVERKLNLPYESVKIITIMKTVRIGQTVA